MNRALAALAAAALVAGCTSKEDSCHAPSIRCGDRCVDASRDPSNCGNCGVTCGAGQTCCGACVDLQTSPSHCGACDARCPAGGVCTAATCSCPPALPTKCGVDPGACVNLATGDGGSCGQCGTVCAGIGVAASDAPCVGGTCQCAGTLDATNCSSTSPAIVCVNTLVDEANCGGCGTDCPPRATCAGGSCTCLSSSADPDFCGTVVGCVNLSNDPANCGGCGTVCAGATPSCSSGKCCPTGFTNCSGTCVNLTTGVGGSCGTCGNVCAAGTTCTAGTCTCPPALPLVCGPLCCSGTACCAGGTECQTQHSNGLGGSFFDCNPLYTPGPTGTTTQQAAIAAADSWGSGNTFFGLCDGNCLARQTTNSCAVWCWAGSVAGGHVTSGATLTCIGLCADLQFGSTPTWQ